MKTLVTCETKCRIELKTNGIIVCLKYVHKHDAIVIKILYLKPILDTDEMLY